MGRRLTLFIVSAATALSLLASEGAASPPTRFSFDIDDTFPSSFLSDFCGIPVRIRVQGSVTVTIHFDKTGTQVVRELDTVPGGLAVTRSSPADEPGGTGKSFTTVEHASSTFLYPEGTAVGDPAIIIATGLQRVTGPGTPRVVGRQVFEAEVIGVTPEGIPVAEPVGVISESGQFGDPEAFFQAICDALTDP